MSFTYTKQNLTFESATVYLVLTTKYAVERRSLLARTNVRSKKYREIQIIQPKNEKKSRPCRCVILSRREPQNRTKQNLRRVIEGQHLQPWTNVTYLCKVTYWTLQRRDNLKVKVLRPNWELTRGTLLFHDLKEGNVGGGGWKRSGMDGCFAVYVHSGKLAVGP